MDRSVYWVWFAQACGRGSRSAVSLLCRFGSPEKIYRADRKKLTQALGEREYSCLKSLSNKDLSYAEDVVRRCAELKIGILTPDNPAYPRPLYQLRDAPVVLYYQGVLPDFSAAFTCAVVGTRTMSEYGRKNSFDIGRALGAGGAILVSGLALGCDGMAMAGALHADGFTVGVLGCGLDITYPPEHRDLMRRVLARGLILSEYPPGTPPAGRHFPVRNRIISGLSDAVVVVEGDLKSGALITARHALYQGRDLYAVPGPISEAGAAGPNNLIKNGARVITNPADILSQYEFLYASSLHPELAARELSGPASSGDVQDVSARTNESGDEGKQYYGGGLYGGVKSRGDTPQKPKPPKKTLTPRKMVERFSEGAPAAAEKKMIAQTHIDLDSLGETEKTVYAALVPDVPVLADDIRVKGIEMPELLAALTLLELCGAVECGAGGYYMRRSADEAPIAPPEE